MTWLLWLGLMLCLLGLVAVGLSAYGAQRWAGQIEGLLGTLEDGRLDGLPTRPSSTGASTPTAASAPHAPQAPDVPSDAPPRRYDARELEGLPAPVQRYFRTVLEDGQPLITAVTIEMAGRFNLSATGEQWRPFRSRQRVTTRRPGFLWDARIAMLPGLTVRVVDSYIVGRGLLHATLQGLFTMARLGGEGEIARGEFMRWFAEVAWYPTALLPSQGVRWEAVDDHSAQATVVDGDLTLTLLFRFNGDGVIGSFRAAARGGMVGGKMVMAPWEGIWSNYQRHDGVLVPCTGEVAWMRPEGRRPYFLGTVTAVRFETAA